MAGGARKLPIWHTISFIVLCAVGRYTIYLWRLSMFGFVVAIIFCGYGIGYEGYDDGKLYIGLYCPSVEYGYVISEKEIYLDTVFIKE